MIATPQFWSPLAEDEIRNRCRGIRHVALDMDGTIYLGSRLFPYSIPFLETLSEMGVTYSFLTNNPTRSVEQYREKLRGLGIDASPDEIYTSSVATIDFIKLHHPDVKRLFVLGTPGMTKEFEEAGFEIAGDADGDIPDMLVVAFDTTLAYPRLCHATWLAAQGIPYIATNPDRVCPTDRDTILVDCGSICECIFHACGRRPDHVIGKPEPEMLRCIMEKRGLAPGQVAMCGDRIYTDVATAQAAGALGVLVLSGETKLETSLAANPRPFLTIPTVADLIPFMTLN